MRRRALILLLLALWTRVATYDQEAAALERLTVGVAAASPGIVWILGTQEEFRKQGLEVDFVLMASSTEAVRAVAARRLPIVVGAGGPAPVHAALAGADVVWIGEFLGTMPYALVVAPEITRPADLRGKRLAVNKLGSSVDFATRYALTRLGLDPSRDVTILQLGDQSVRLAALTAKTVEGTMMSAPATVVGRKLGLRTLTDLAQLGLKYPHEGLVTSRAVLRERPDLVRRFLRAAVVGIRRYKTDRPWGIELMRSRLKISDTEALDEAYSVFSRLVLAKPYLAPEAVQLVLDELAPTDHRARAAKPEDFLDMRFVREVDDAGIIDALYR